MQSDRDKEQTRTVGVGMAEDVAGVDHPDRAKHGLTRKGGDHVADQTKARQDEDVNLGVAKKPEQVHIEHGVVHLST